MQTHTLEFLKRTLSEFEVVGNIQQVAFSNTLPIEEANEDSIVWIKSSRKDKIELIRNTKAKTILCDNQIDVPDDLKNDKCFIVLKSPRLEYSKIVSAMYAKKYEWGIHHTAIIHPDAELHKDIYIGPFTYIGNCKIDQNTVLDGHNYVYDNVVIGKNVIIHAHAVIGSEGFGFTRYENGELEKFPHIGTVVIEDDVEIYPFVNVDKGALAETRIKRGAKIDHYCHIGHNTITGENSLLTAGTVLCGGSKVGDRTWVGVGSIIKEKIKVGDDVTLGLGAIVTKDIPNNETWLGQPARPLKEFVELQQKLKNI